MRHTNACDAASDIAPGFKCICEPLPSASERTPGPWSNNGGQIEGLGGYPNVVAHVGIVNEQTEQDTANARLIASAPELLEALRAMIDMATDNRTHGVEIDRACEIIAKAEGR